MMFLAWPKHDIWIGLWYPDASDKSQVYASYPMDSFGECVRWTSKKEHTGNTSATECGKNCTYSHELQAYVCEEVVK